MSPGEVLAGGALAIVASQLVSAWALALGARLRARDARERRAGDDLMRRLVRATIAGDAALVRFGPEDTPLRLAGALVRCLDIADEGMMARLADMAGRQRLAPALRLLMRSRAVEDRADAARLLGHVAGTGRILRRLARRDPSPEVRVAAVLSLARLGEPMRPRDWSACFDLSASSHDAGLYLILRDPALAGDGALRALLAHPRAGEHLKVWAVRLLGSRSETPDPALLVAVCRHDGATPAMMVEALGRLQDLEALDDLRALCAVHPDWRVRSAWHKAVLRLQGLPEEAVLAQIRQDPDWRVRAILPPSDLRTAA